MVYHIRIRGYLSDHWGRWFAGFAVTLDDHGATLHGGLKNVRDGGTPLISVPCFFIIQDKDETMNSIKKPMTVMEDRQVPVQAKLAAAWTSFMFLYIYVDYFHLYKAGAIDDIRAGVVFDFKISPTYLTTVLALVSIPALMILLSMILPARANRVTNLVVAALEIPFAAFNAAGESWEWAGFYGLSIGLEVLILLFILRSAWTWPRTTAPSMTEPAAPHRPQIQMGR